MSDGPGIADAYPLTGYQLAALMAGPPAGHPAQRITVMLPGPRVEREVLLRATAEVIARQPALRTDIDQALLLQCVRPPAPPGTEASYAVSLAGPAVTVSCGHQPAVTLSLPGPLVDLAGAVGIAAALARSCRGQDPGDGPTLTTRDAAAAEHALDRGARVAAADHFAPALAELSRRQLVSGTRTVTRRARLPVGQFDALTAAADRLGLPAWTLLFAAGYRLLSRLAGQRKVASWLVMDPEGDQGGLRVGEFRTSVPVAVDAGGRDQEDLTRAVLAEVTAAAPHQRYPAGPRAGITGAWALEWRALPAAPALARARLAYRDHPVTGQGITLTRLGDGAIEVQVESPDAVQVLPRYLSLLDQVISGQAPGGARRPVAPAPRPRPAPDVTVTDVIRAAAERSPDAVAVTCGDRDLSYAGLMAAAETAAAHLAAAGARPGRVIALHLPRSIELIVAMLGVLTTGAAYLSLDPDYPPLRSAAALADSGASLLVADATRGAPAFDGPVLPSARLSRPAPAARLVPPRPAADAYILFTSGSTGRPKGVAVPHRALVNLLRWSAGELGLRPGDRVAQRTSVAFDAGVWELMAPLAAGATVVVLPGEVNRDIAALEAGLAQGEVSVLQTVPSLLQAHLEAGTLARSRTLRLVLCGGETLRSRLAAEFAAQCPHARLVNVYGPTECCVDATWWTATSRDQGDSVPIGTAVAGVIAHVLDETGEIADPLVPGELVLGGAQLATGYAGRPGATADRFIPDHLTGQRGGRLYRTGDRVRRLPGGELEFLGRMDRQVKIRGVRTELAEIEAVIAAHPAVALAAVAVAGDPGEAVLHAHVVLAAGASPPANLAGDLREHAAVFLPAPMVPAFFFRHDRLPVLPNGKVDVAALRPPGRQARASFRPATDPARKWLARTWAGLLAVDDVGVLDNLVELGADSVLALRMTGLIAGRQGLRLDPRELLAAATVERQAELLARKEPREGGA